MIEVEQKFRLTKENQKRIQGVLDARYGKVDAVRQVDTVFLLEGNSLATFKRGDSVMRIRLAGDDSVTLTYKRALDGGEDRMEYELSVDSAETAKCLLQEIGYIPIACVDRRRRTYECGNVVVTLDDVEKLGAFIEIEVLCKDESDISSARQEIDRVAKEFHLEEKDRESRKYDELLADKD